MYGSASELRATLEYDFSQEKDFGDAKVDIQDEKVDIESVLSEKSSDFSVKTTVHNHRLFEKFGFDEVFGRSAVMELLELKSSGASKLLANLTQAEIIEPVSGHGKGKYKFNKVCLLLPVLLLFVRLFFPSNDCILFFSRFKKT